MEKIENSETEPHIFGHLISYKRAKAVDLGKEMSFQKQHSIKWISLWKKTNISPYIIPYG